MVFTDESMCIYEGLPVSPEMQGCCSRCNLYLSTCAPIIRSGFLSGAECDVDYCEFCDAYGECGMYFTVTGGDGYAEAV